MFTVCPKCALTLVVTAADLRIAQGYVRCGRCSSVFNALARLSDDRQQPISATESAPSSTPAPEESTGGAAQADLSPLEEALSQPDEESIPEDALEFNPDTADVGAVFVEPPPNPQWTAATGSFKALRAASQDAGPEAPAEPSIAIDDSQVDVEIDADFLADMLRDATPASEPQGVESQRAELRRSATPAAPPAQPPRAPAPVKEPPPPDAPEATPQRIAAPARPTAHATPSRASPHTRPPVEAVVQPRSAAAHPHTPRVHQAPAARTPAAQEAATSSALEIAPDETTVDADVGAGHRETARIPRGAWAAGAALALLVLLTQIVNHHRDELAANPRFNRPLTALYGALGVQLVPHWDLRAYDVRQLGASADPAGSGLITVRASIKNAGHLAQPLPLLRVTLQDRFGNRIAARDVAPRFYVPHTMPDSSYLAGGQRIDAEMGFVDPGANAVGFEIDACLPASGGGVTCANDLGGR